MKKALLSRPWFPVLLGLSGCVTVEPGRDYEQAADYIQRATGELAVAPPAEGEDVVNSKVEELLHDGISAKEAVQIALLKNPAVQAAFFRIGVARAEVVQSGLLSNPSLALAVRFPTGGGLANIEAELFQSIADLWQIPLRKSVAERELKEVILEVARRASLLVFQVKKAYYRLLASERIIEIATENVRIARELMDLAVQQRDAGVGNEADVNAARSDLLRKELAVKQAEVDAHEGRCELASLLGFTTDLAPVELDEDIPEPPSWSVTVEELLTVARKHRLDVRAREEQVRALEARIAEEKRLFLRVVKPGVSVEREAGEDTSVVVGPAIDLELPLFDQNQARIARAEFAYFEAQKKLESLLVSLSQEIRSAHRRAEKSGEIVRFYRERLLPQQKENLGLAREAYSAGLSPFTAVLDAQRTFVEARGEYVRALRASAEALVDLEKAAGQPLEKVFRRDQGRSVRESTLDSGASPNGTQQKG